MTPNEMNLTQQDLAFKQAVVTDVETKVREILPALVTATIRDELDQWIDEIVETVNELELQLELLKQKKSIDLNDVLAEAVHGIMKGATNESTPTDTDS